MSKIKIVELYDVMPPVNIAFTHSRRKAERYMRRLGDACELIDADAQTATLKNGHDFY